MDLQSSATRIGAELAAILTIPRARTSVPAVLLLHGFGSQKDEVGGLFSLLAGRLGGAGVASLRFDFRGFGESAGDSVHASLHTMVEDAVRALAFLRGVSAVDSTRIRLAGFSLGGVIAASVGAIERGVHPLVLWATPRTAEGIRGCVSPAELAVLEIEGRVEIALGWRNLRIGTPLLRSLGSIDVCKALAFQRAPFTAIVGARDPLAAHIPDFAAALSPDVDRDLRLIQGADHTFGAAAGALEAAEELIDRTVMALA